MKTKILIAVCLAMAGWIGLAEGQVKFQNYFSLTDATCAVERSYGSGVATDGSNYFICGDAYFSSTWSCNPNTDLAFISKISSSGNLVYSWHYDEGSFTHIRYTHDNKILAAGQYGSPGYFSVLLADPSTTSAAGSISSSGCWYKQYGTANGFALDVVESSNGTNSSGQPIWDGYCAVGVDKSTGIERIFIEKLNADGSVQHDRIIDLTTSGSANNRAYSVVEASDGDFVVTGGQDGICFVLKISHDLSIIHWSNVFSITEPTSFPTSCAYSIKETNDHLGFVMTGDAQFGSPTMVVSFIVDFSSSGSKNWAKFISHTSTISMGVTTDCILEDADGLFWLCGQENYHGLIMEVSASSGSASIFKQQAYSMNGNNSFYYDLLQTGDKGFFTTGNSDPNFYLVANKTNTLLQSTNGQTAGDLIIEGEGGGNNFTAFVSSRTPSSNSAASSSGTNIGISGGSFTSTQATTILSDIDFISTPCNGSLSGSYTFQTQNAPSGTSLTYDWDFGDGVTASYSSSSATTTQTHTYSGTHWQIHSSDLVSLHVSSGATSTDRNETIIYGNDIPSQSIALTPGSSSGVFQFALTSAWIGPGESYHWDFGDGSVIYTTSATSPFPHTYSSWSSPADNYSITLNVYDAGGFPIHTGTYQLVYGQELPTTSNIIVSKSYSCSTGLGSIVISGMDLYASPDFQYSWVNTTTGFGTTQNINSPNDLNTSFVGDGSVTQTFQLTVTNDRCNNWQQDVSILPFLANNNSISANSQTNFSGEPQMDFMVDEPTYDITNWVTFLPYPAATLSISGPTDFSGPLVTNCTTASTLCSVSLSPSTYWNDPVTGLSNLGNPTEMTYTWTDPIGCQTSKSVEFVISDAEGVT